MGSWLVETVIKAFLEWLRSLWERFIQKQKHIEQGRKEVRDAVNEASAKKRQEIEDEAKKLRDTDSTWDDTSNWLRDRANSGGSDLPKNK